ncbi:MAG TPA: glycosyltransferase family 4 protein [Verrucomicrobiae bacterium]|nr:glycosyltransferase family 4 protein [Verrucomicrobiae bacterium]
MMAERKKIALCLEYPLALRGGVSVLVETLLEGLRERYEIVLVSPDNSESLRKQPAGEFISGHIPWTPSAVSAPSSEQLARELARQKVKLAHFHIGGVYGWGNRFLRTCPIPRADKLGIAVFSTVHLVVSPLDGYCGPQKPLWFKLAMLPLAYSAKLRQLAHVRSEIAVSRHDAEKLRRWYRPLRGKFIHMYQSRLKKKSLPANDSAREPFVLNVGHIAWRKGQIVLAEAFAQVATRHPEWKLLMAGALLEVPTVEKIKAIAKTNGLEDRILLPGERRDAMELMQRARIYVQPSYHEALGLALQEALFSACPAIGTRAGGIPELIEHERTGLLVEPGNPMEMAKALELLMCNPSLRERYGKQGAASILQKGMTAEQMVARHVELYESVLGIRP